VVLAAPAAAVKGFEEAPRAMSVTVGSMTDAPFQAERLGGQVEGLLRRSEDGISRTPSAALAEEARPG
jgi:hypothetical protein